MLILQESILLAIQCCTGWIQPPWWKAAQSIQSQLWWTELPRAMILLKILALYKSFSYLFTTATQALDNNNVHKVYSAKDDHFKQVPWQHRDRQQRVAKGMHHSDTDRLCSLLPPGTQHITPVAVAEVVTNSSSSRSSNRFCTAPRKTTVSNAAQKNNQGNVRSKHYKIIFSTG